MRMVFYAVRSVDRGKSSSQARVARVHRSRRRRESRERCRTRLSHVRWRCAPRSVTSIHATSQSSPIAPIKNITPALLLLRIKRKKKRSITIKERVVTARKKKGQCILHRSHGRRVRIRVLPASSTIAEDRTPRVVVPCVVLTPCAI